MRTRIRNILLESLDSQNTFLVYHSSKNKFEKFSRGHLGTNTFSNSAKKGFFFSDNKYVALSYHSKGATKESDLMSKRYDAADKIKEQLKNDESISDFTFRYLTQPVFNNNSYLERSPYSQKEFEYIRSLLDELNEIEDDLQSFQEIGLVDDEVYELDENAFLYTCEITINNPLIHDFKNKSFRDVLYSDLIDVAIKSGNDGCIFKNTFDPGSSTGLSDCNIFVVFSENQIKILSVDKA